MFERKLLECDANGVFNSKGECENTNRKTRGALVGVVDVYGKRMTDWFGVWNTLSA